jgi:hypothetical protein
MRLEQMLHDTIRCGSMTSISIGLKKPQTNLNILTFFLIVIIEIPQAISSKNKTKKTKQKQNKQTDKQTQKTDLTYITKSFYV